MSLMILELYSKLFKYNFEGFWNLDNLIDNHLSDGQYVVRHQVDVPKISHLGSINQSTKYVHMRISKSNNSTCP